MHEREHFLHARSDALTRPVMGLQPIGHVLPDIHMGKEGVALKHDADATAVGRQVIDALTIEQHAALTLADEAGNDPQEGRFPATRRPEQSDKLPAVNAELHVIDRDKVSEPMGDAIEPQVVPAFIRLPDRLTHCRLNSLQD